MGRWAALLACLLLGCAGVAPEDRPPEAAVRAVGELEELLGEARETLRASFAIDLRGVAIEAELLAREALQAAAGPQAHPELGAFLDVHETLERGRVVARRYRLCAQAGLSRAYLRGILCHELIHVWQAEEGGMQASVEPALREGAAQAVAQRVLAEAETSPWAEELLTDPDPVYGEGLRRFRRLAADRGWKAALRLSVRGPGFPAGY